MIKSKKLIVLLCMLCMIIGVMPYAYADDATGGTEDTITWSYDATSKVLAFTGAGAMTNYTESAPAPWENDTVTQAVSIVVGEGITELGSCAFDNFKCATTVNLPSTLTTINASWVFNNCQSLDSITFPEGFTRLDGEGVFNGCYALNTIELPYTVTDIGDASKVFRKTPESCKLIVEDGSYAHTYAVANASVQILLSGSDIYKTGMAYEVVKIGGTADAITWSYYRPTKTLTITGSGAIAAYSSTSPAPWGTDTVRQATSIVVGEGITELGSRAFEGFKSATEVSLPSTLKMTRGGYVFNNCQSLTCITFPDGFKDMEGTGIFNACNALEKIVLPATVEKLVADTFIKTPESCKLIVVRGSYAHEFAESIKDKSILLSGSESNGTAKYKTGMLYEAVDLGGTEGDITWSYDYPNTTLTVTGEGAIADYTTTSPAPWMTTTVKKATSIVVDEGITAIGSRAFEFFNAATEISLPSTLTQLAGSYAFNNCTALTSITFPDGFKSINYGGNFNACNALEQIVLPDTVDYLASADEVFKKTPETCKLIVKCGSYAHEYAIDNAETVILLTGSVANDDATYKTGMQYEVSDLEYDYYVRYSNRDKTATIVNYSDNAKDAFVFIANYTDGRLTDVYLETKTLALGNNAVTADELSQINGSVTKVIVTDTDMAPLCEACVTKITPAIRIAGDSISAEWPATRYGQQGWGKSIEELWTDDVEIMNDAVSGWTTEKYYNEKWPTIKQELRAGDYLLVSYLHNDYYVWYNNQSEKADYIDTYKGYLQKLIDETKAMGVNIVLVVPPNRGVAENFHGDFSYVMPKLAEDKNVPCIDIHATTLSMLQTDLEGTKKLLYMYKLIEQGIITQEQFDSHSNSTYRNAGDNVGDLTHLSTQGAAWVADYVSDELVKIYPDLASCLVQE